VAGASKSGRRINNPPQAASLPHISLLRGINVGGHHKLYESLGLRRAQTYVQSGNVVFRTDARDFTRLSNRIADALEQRFAFRPGVILRTAADLRAVIAANPFASRRDLDPSKLLVQFLASEPPADARERILRIEAEPDELRMEGRELYIYYPNGMARPKVAWTVIERKLQTPCTGRNWNTVRKLLEMAESLDAS
jgi:uncharacterized protein (DUF1697 family)